MKFSVNWLREFVDLPDNIDNLAELLTLAGVEIEGIEKRGAKIDKVIVGQIAASSPHPNADRLSVCEVDDGSGTKRQVVCGAKNYKVGDKVPLALPGTKLPNGLDIRKSKLRGVESDGMLCSAIELGLGDDAAGLLILSPDAKIGRPIVDLFPADTILDVEITPNRGDLLSHYGLAREIAALTQKQLQTRPLKAVKFSGKREAAINISAPNECPFYSARKIDNVKVGPSPDWLRAKIESVGIRSINNIVDISNFVMLELGQPTHAFDADKLKGGINARLARDNEKFLALDGKTYSLTPQDLIIADDERAVGIGGVMGGEETGVSESTKNILLEAAYFLPAAIRRTSRELNLPSDASYRFERGVDPGMVLLASTRATELMREIGGGTPAKGIATAGELPADRANVSLAYEKCDRLLGIAIESKRVDESLTRFGLSKKTRPLKAVKSNEGRKVSEKAGSTWEIPSYRRDLERDVDLVEEVVRAYGVQKISGSDRSRFTLSSAADRVHDLEIALRERLIGYGLSEARTSKLIARTVAGFGEGAVGLRNPLTEDHVALRPSLISGLLGVWERNVRASAERVAIFEMGRVFVPPQGKEERRLGILLWGKVANASHWRSGEKRSVDIVDLKGAMEAVSKFSFRRSKHVDLALAMEIFAGDTKIGFAGQLRFAAALVAEINLDSLFAQTSRVVFKEMERFPSVTRDIAMIVPDELTHEKMMETIWAAGPTWLQSVAFFDLVVGKKAEELFGPGKKSVAYRLTYRDRSRTLTNEEVAVAHAKVRERLRDEIGAELRE